MTQNKDTFLTNISFNQAELAKSLGLNVGEPRSTEVFSKEELEGFGMSGLYSDDSPEDEPKLLEFYKRRCYWYNEAGMNLSQQRLLGN